MNIFFHSCLIRQAVPVLCTGRNGRNFSAPQFCKGRIICIIRFKHQNLIPGIAQTEHCHFQGFAAAIGNIDILGFVMHAPIVIIFLNCFDQVGIALGIAIRNNLLVKLTDSFHKLWRSSNVRLPDIQVINLLPFLFGSFCVRRQLPNRRSLHSQRPFRNLHVLFPLFHSCYKETQCNPLSKNVLPIDINYKACMGKPQKK